jgi:hypothetical protein
MAKLVHSRVVSAGRPYYRITAPTYVTNNAAQHPQVVNGQGSVKSHSGARYSSPNALTVYLTETVEACLSEKLFYFHREYLPKLDSFHTNYPGNPTIVPPFEQTFTLWEITFKAHTSGVAALDAASAGHFGVYPCLLNSPSQDYLHLKSARARIQASGYNGLIASSSRDATGGMIVVLFSDQSNNVQSITHHDVDLRLIQPQGAGAFTNHAHQMLDHSAGEFSFTASYPPLAGPSPYAGWTHLGFRR